MTQSSLEKKETKVYLDFHIIVALLRNEYYKNKYLIFSEMFKNKKILIPYSYTHIEEIINIPLTDIHEKQDEIDTFLKFLSKVSSNVYWVYTERDNKISDFIKHPKDTYNSVIITPITDIAVDMFLNIVIERIKKQYKEELKSFPLNFNITKPKEMVNEIDRIVKDMNKDFKFLKIIDECFEFYPLKIPNLYYKSILMFEIIDLFGHFPENPPVKTGFGRSSDAQHTYYASSCDFFITDDKRTKYISEVVYDTYDIKTEIVTSEDAHLVLQNV